MADLILPAVAVIAMIVGYLVIVSRILRDEHIPPRHEQLVRDALADDLHDVFPEEESR
ncbi:hypothetical protein [Nonomuraea guangzhouensis]|uniref:Uncharacterized protein n=1 Tax=Nonomuraea guangzhouensis TaxID=1291555 RepID=A0ABW4GWS9_9ACTN|nr:hypothetical protein [Nonomuraea guangzhouensis]